MPSQKIVVLNDDQLFLQVVQRLFMRAGYEAVTGHVGPDGHDLICHEQPDLVVLDMQRYHPEEGWQQLRSLRADPATASLPVLMYSSDVHLLRKRAEQLHEAQVAILELPFTPDELLHKIKSVLGA